MLELNNFVQDTGSWVFLGGRGLTVHIAAEFWRLKEEHVQL